MNRRGIALVAVLWGLLAAGAVALAFSSAMRGEARATRNAADGVRAYYRARTGVHRAAALLASLPQEEARRRPLSEEDGGEGYAVAVEDEGGRIDVNESPGEVIRAALENLGAGRGEAEALAAAIEEWRSPAGEGGGDPAAYASLPEPIRPRRGRIASLDELRHVRGMTPEAFRRWIAPAFTVHGSSRVNVNEAPPAVLRAVGLTAAQAERLVRLREEEPFRSQPRLAEVLAREGVTGDAAGWLAVSTPARVFTIRARGWAGEAQRRILCRVDVSAAGKEGVRVVRWEDMVPAEEGS